MSRLPVRRRRSARSRSPAPAALRPGSRGSRRLRRPRLRQSQARGPSLAYDAGRDPYDRALTSPGRKLSLRSQEFRSGGPRTTWGTTAAASSRSAIPWPASSILSTTPWTSRPTLGRPIIAYSAEPAPPHTRRSASPPACAATQHQTDQLDTTSPRTDPHLNSLVSFPLNTPQSPRSTVGTQAPSPPLPRAQPAPSLATSTSTRSTGAKSRHG